MRRGVVSKARENDRKDKGVDEQEQQRVDKRPEKPQDGSTVSRLELAGHQGLNQPSIPNQAQ